MANKKEETSSTNDITKSASQIAKLNPLAITYTKSPNEVCKLLDVNPQKGLSKAEVQRRTEEYGKNELPHDPPTPLWELILEQFKDQLVLILLGAAVISFFLAAFETDEHEKTTAFVEPIVILLILIANAVVGVIQESNAEKAIEALMEFSPDDTTVIRDGLPHKIHAKDLVPGDIVSLSVGDKIPADCRLLEVTSSAFRVDQAILTGESISVEKTAQSVVSDIRAVKQDQVNILFSGTTITIGKAIAIVVQTGTSTAIGHIHNSISSQIDEKTPLKQALDDFGDQLARIISVICILVWVINVRHFNDATFNGNWLKGAVYYFKIAVALAVAAIPEGLAVVITTCLALGTKKMAAQGAIVRKLRSVETLGCTNVICSDKTGTLTTNQMSARKILLVENGNGEVKEFDVEGTTYGPEGRVYLASGKPCDRDLLVSHQALNELAHVACLCNDAKIVYDEEALSFQKIGEPTEAALRAMVEKLGTDSPEFNQQIPIINTALDLAQLSSREKLWRSGKACEYIESMYKKLTTLEFSRERKSMSVIVEKLESPKKGTQFLMVKGAPEQILERSSYIRLSSSPDKEVPLTETLRAKILNKMLEWGEGDALRVLAFATTENPSIPEKIDPGIYLKLETDLTFIGMVGMLDPPRPEVKTSITKCRAAGIRVIVITGDNKKTAESICRQIGIFKTRENLEGKSYTSREWEEMSTDQKRGAVRRASLFSRAEPLHKQELVDLLKNEGCVVAMTGDGVNDAPALKKADIGISMGSGTDVAKLASDMVLADDNFATIVAAVEEGRSIYANTKQFIRYLISSNIGEVVSIFLTVILGMPEALIPVQLLWVNLVTDGLPATALGFNPADHDIMKRPPRDSKEPIVTAWLFIRYMVVGTYVGMATVFGYAWWFMFYSGGPHITFYQLTNFHKCHSLFPDIGCEMFTNFMSKKATTMSLSILVVVEMFNAMNSLSENESLITFSLSNNVYLILAILLSMGLHFMILYVPFFTNLFAIVQLNYEEWKWVLLISFPVIIVDEILKYISREFVSKQTAIPPHKKRA